MQVKIYPVGENECRNCGMREHSLFADLTHEDFRLINQPIHDMSVSAGTSLFDEGAPGQYLFTIRSGLVKLVRYQTDGSLRIIRLLTPGDIAGLETTAHPTYNSAAITVTDVNACRIPLGVIQRLEKDSPRLHMQLLRKWHEALKQADDFIADLASGSARQRLARLLLRLANGDSAQHVVLPAREDVGAMLGITTETASRAVAAFRREGLLEALDRQGRRFRVDAEALTTVASRGA
jgi:CRP-like cAMP-binding protein